MSDVDSLPEFSEDEEVAEITEEIADDGKKKKKEKVKVDPPLMNRPSTPDDWERYEPTPFQLVVACNDLPNGDGFRSLSDPCAILYMKDQPTGKWFEVGRTERIKDNLNPEFAKRIDVDFFDQEEDDCRIEVYDWNKNYTDLKKHTFLGMWSGPFSALCKGGDFFNKELQMMNKDGTGFNKKKAPSTIRMGALPVSGEKVIFQMQFEAVGIDKASRSGKTDAYMEMAISTDNDDEYITFHRTEVIKKTTDPKWARFQLTANQLSAELADRHLKITVNHWSKKGPKEIGCCTTSFGELRSRKEAGEDIEFVLINKEKQTGKKADKYTNSGTVKLVSLKRKNARVKKQQKERAVAPAEEAPETAPEGPCGGAQTLEIPELMDNAEPAAEEEPAEEEAADEAED